MLGLFVFIYTHFYYHIDLWLRKRKIEKIANKFYYNDHDILAEADYTYLKLENFGSNLNKLTTILEKVGNNSNTSVHANSIVNNSLIVLLEFRYKDFDLSASGKLDDVDKKKLFFIKFELKPKNKNLIVKGEVYTDRFDKNRIMNFLSSLDLEV